MHTVTKSSRVGVSAFDSRGGERFASSPHEQSCVLYDYSSRTLYSPYCFPPPLPCIHQHTALLYPFTPRSRLFPPRPHARIPRPPLPPRPLPRRGPGRPQCGQQCHRPRRHMEQQLGSFHGWCESRSSFRWAVLITVAGYMCTRRDEI